MYKFDGKRYITRGVNENIPLDIQIIIWELIDNLVKNDVKTDYLQIVEISSFPSVEGISLILTHSQEVEPYKKKYEVRKYKESLNFRIYVIDDIEHCTMMLASEY